jgi:hypothetical protein
VYHIHPIGEKISRILENQIIIYGRTSLVLEENINSIRCAATKDLQGNGQRHNTKGSSYGFSWCCDPSDG